MNTIKNRLLRAFDGETIIFRHYAVEKHLVCFTVSWFDITDLNTGKTVTDLSAMDALNIILK